MGQLIDVTSTTIVADVVVFDTDRSITGQDGSGFASGEEAVSAPGLAARLAARLFDAVAGVDNVWIASSQVVVRRPGGWSDDAVAGAADVVRRFFVFYEETAAAS